MTPPLLSIDGLNVSIEDVPIISNLSLEVGEGEVLGLVGASGSGKSMTALAIMQLLPGAARSSGMVRLQGVALTGMSILELRSIRGRSIGMVFQEPMSALNPLMRIGEQVAETARLHGAASGRQASNLAREALDAVGLDQIALDRYPHELSGGQRQRVAIAIAVVLRPALLIADEPTTALDVVAQARVLALLCDLARTRRMGLLLVSHDLAVISQVTDRVAVMQAGAIVETGATAATLRALRHPYSKALLAAAVLAPKRQVAAPGAHSPGAAALDADAPSAAAQDTVTLNAVAPGGDLLNAAALTADVLSAGTRGADAAMCVLEVRGIVREYPLPWRSPWRRAPGFRAVDGVSLTIHAGETVGLVGESGSGKSTLLRAILGLERIQAGEVRLLGEPLLTATAATRRRLRRSLQAVFQDPYGSFDPRWSVEKLIAEPFHLWDVPPDRAQRRRTVATVLERVGLSPADAGRHPQEFSGGQRQRIAIARALITEPRVIAFDEAVSALDVLVRAQILDLLADLADRLRLAYLFVSHDLTVVRAIADRVYVMQQGRIVEHGPTARVFGAPQSSYTKTLIAATPSFGAAPAAQRE